MKKILLILLALMLTFTFIACDPEGEGPGAEAPKMPVLKSYTNEVTVNNAGELFNAMKTLQADTLVKMKAGVYNLNDTTNNPATNLLISVNNVAFVADVTDDEIVKIESSDTNKNGAWAQQQLIIIDGDDVVLSGLTIGRRGSDNKAIEVRGDNAIILNCTFATEAAGIYVNTSAKYDATVGDDKTVYVDGVTIAGCKFNGESGISITNGVKGSINVIYNTFAGTTEITKEKWVNSVLTSKTFDASTYFYVTGHRWSGWNYYGVEMSDAVLYGNTMGTGANVQFKATDSMYDDSFPMIDVLEAFGITADGVETTQAWAKKNAAGQVIDGEFHEETKVVTYTK